MYVRASIISLKWITCGWVLLLSSSVHALDQSIIDGDVICSCLSKMKYSCDDSSTLNVSMHNSMQIIENESIPARFLTTIINSNMVKNNHLESALKVRKQISALYACTGLISSGAVLEKDGTKDSKFILRIIEGKISKKDIIIKHDNKKTKNIRLSDEYIKEKILGRGDSQVLNIRDIRQNLEVLRRTPLIYSVKSTVSPIERGRAKLVLEVTDNKPHHFQLTLNNHQSKSLGSNQIILEGFYFGKWQDEDSANIKGAFSSGSTNIDIGYQWTVLDKNILSINIGKRESNIVTSPFTDLDIKSDINFAVLRHTYGLGKSYKSNTGTATFTEQSIHTGLEVQDTKNSLLGRPFSFSQGENDGKSRIVSLQSQYQWNKTNRIQATSLNLGLDLGLDVFNATVNEGGIADSKYLSLIGQFQYKNSLPYFKGNQLKLHLAGQFTEDSMLSSKKFTMGGASTLRGVEQNFISRDSGLVATSELLVPIANWTPIKEKLPLDGRLFLNPFIDFGAGQNSHRQNKQSVEIATAGLGLKWDIGKGAILDVSWAKPIYDSGLSKQQQSDIKDGEFHLQVSLPMPLGRK